LVFFSSGKGCSNSAVVLTTRSTAHNHDIVARQCQFDILMVVSA
jgi:hypothetical protein